MHHDSYGYLKDTLNTSTDTLIRAVIHIPKTIIVKTQPIVSLLVERTPSTTVQKILKRRQYLNILKAAIHKRAISKFNHSQKTIISFSIRQSIV